MTLLLNQETHRAIIGVLLSALMFFVLSSNLVDSAVADPAPNTLFFRDVVEQINMTRLEKDIQTLESLGSRFTGYAGHERAAQFVFDKFVEYGLKNVDYEPFVVAVPYDHGANITIASTGEVVSAYTLTPNLIETCAIRPEGLAGPLIYVGDSDIPDYDGKNVDGSIVLIDFDCMTKWQYCILFGAKAAIFIEEETTHNDAASKSLGIPLDFPRLYVKKEDGEYLKSLIRSSETDGIEVTIRSHMEYRNFNAKNVVGFVEGKSLSNEYVVVAAHYDSFSVVPLLSPGAEEACGIATLLELVRFFTRPQNRPERSIMFLALSGNGQNLAGAREFVYQHIDEVGRKLRLFISLNIYSGSKSSAALYWGTMYRYSKPIGRYQASGLIENLRRFLSNIESQTGEEPLLIDLLLQSESVVFNNLMSESFALASEPFTLAGGLGIGFATIHSLNLFLGTPFDSSEKINYQNLELQVQTIFYVINCFLNDLDLELPEQKLTIATSTGGWVDHLSGEVLEYSREIAWWVEIPNALVVVSQFLPFRLGFELFTVVMADESGRYEVHGLLHRNSPESQNPVAYSTRAFLDDPTFGPVEYVPDSGRYGDAAYPSSSFTIDLRDKSVQTVVFRCGSLALIGVSDPTKPSTMFQGVTVDVRLFKSDSTPDFLWSSTSLSDRLTIAMVYAQPEEIVEVILKPGREREPYAVLVNASSENPGGNGFRIMGNMTVMVHNLRMLSDLFYINEGRLSGAAPLMSSQIHQETRLRVQRAHEFIENHNYSALYGEILEAWSWERSAYIDVKVFFRDVIGTGIFYFVLLLPFLALSERFLFKEAGMIKRIARMGGIFTLFMVIFYFLHPGLRMASNLFMVISGFFLAVLLIPGLLILATNTISILKKARLSLLGAHFAEASHGSQLATTFTLGIENLKRRRLRSTLNLLTIMLLVFSLVALTSMSSIRVTRPYEFTGTTVYDGILVRSARPGSPLESIITTRIVDYMRTKYSEPDIVSVRAYFYPPVAADRFAISGPNGQSTTIQGVIGLSVSEPQITHLDASLVSGNWFALDSERACLIPEEVASRLNVGIHDEIFLESLKMRVRGIFNSTWYSLIVDLDQDTISPLTGGGHQSGVLQRVPPSSMIVLPYGLAKKLGASSYSIAIKPGEKSTVLESARRLADTFPGLFMRSGMDGRIVSFYSDEVSSFTGWQMLMVPLVIAAFTMTNVLLGSIYERTKEIGIFASLGLSPLQVSLMFLGESSLYAAMGSVLGYVLGLFVNRLVRELSLLPLDVAPNIASSWLISSIGISIGATFLATLYPMLKASKLVTPSLERSWKVPTKPSGDEWEIPLPYELQNREVNGVIAFLHEFLQANTTEESGSFWVRDLKMTDWKEREVSVKSLEMIARIVPYEANIEQECKILFIEKMGSDRNTVALGIKRIYGILNAWKHSNRAFIDVIRKQLLMWRSLRPEERQRYIESAHKIFP